MPARATLRLAVVQDTAVPGDVATNVETAASRVREAAAQGAGLVALPETFTTSWDLDAFDGPLPTLDDLAWLAPVQAAVEETGAVLVLSSPLASGGRRTITSLVIAPGRQPVAAYDKQHLYPPERERFEPGEHGATIEVDGVRVALSVCYDANFPEHAAAAAADGAICYLNTGAYFPGGAHRRDLHYAARALDNSIYVAFAGLVGGPLGLIGGSAVYDPLGMPVQRLDDTNPGMVVATIDPAEVTRVREEQRMWSDRRVELGPRRTFSVSTRSP
ncbi:putative amidohydrolase [Nocardioides albertanoniae]|uniref:Putative amidohydrolase n=1 Tax=Nocardioides albertanoniae TaxID=1175486 RepID=A0A543A5L5_9ACTN|nr:carbon-nitrogen hydrolase family protein [Nocardioides albertanoniae]TQL67776.1 putative amidohydrolase [Nocardioides albertanoniae]